MTNAHMLRVFVDEKGEFGDATPVIIDEDRKIADAERLTLAIKLGAPEAVFVNDLANAEISIMHLQGEVDFAGTPALGVAWLLAQLRHEPTTVMRGRKGDIIVSQDGGLTWVRTSLATMPPWHHKHLENAKAVENIRLKDTAAMEHTMVWAWIDEAKGLIRARTFAPDWDIPEAQGNGSGSMMLAAMLNRMLEITHGDGSVIFTRPAPDNCADVGGRIAEDQSANV